MHFYFVKPKNNWLLSESDKEIQSGNINDFPTFSNRVRSIDNGLVIMSRYLLLPYTASMGIKCG